MKKPNTEYKSWFTITTNEIVHIIMNASTSELLGITHIIQKLIPNWSVGNYYYAQLDCNLVREALWKRVWYGKIKCKRTRESLSKTIDDLAKIEGVIMSGNRK